MAERELRLLDANRHFVRTLDEEEARDLIRAGQATLRTGGRRPLLVLKSTKTVEAFETGAASLGGAAIQSTYTEQHAGQKLVVMKRHGRGGDLLKWDNDLTFDELRQGRIISSARAIELQLAERARRNARERQSPHHKAA